MSAHPIPKVLVVGGGGYFGQLLVQELLQYTHAHIILASRNRSRLMAVCRTFESRHTDRVATIVMDMNQAESVKAALAGAQIVICAAGPYQKNSREHSSQNAWNEASIRSILRTIARLLRKCIS